MVTHIHAGRPRFLATTFVGSMPSVSECAGRLPWAQRVARRHAAGRSDSFESPHRRLTFVSPPFHHGWSPPCVARVGAISRQGRRIRGSSFEYRLLPPPSSIRDAFATVRRLKGVATMDHRNDRTRPCRHRQTAPAQSARAIDLEADNAPKLSREAAAVLARMVRNCLSGPGASIDRQTDWVLASSGQTEGCCRP